MLRRFGSLGWRKSNCCSLVDADKFVRVLAGDYLSNAKVGCVVMLC